MISIVIEQLMTIDLKIVPIINIYWFSLKNIKNLAIIFEYS